MFRLLYCLLFCGCFFIADAEAGKPKFIEGLEDIPLMDGMTQKNTETVSFGNEESRFVEVFILSPKAGFKRIEKFYKESLPQLGWNYQGTADNSIVFYRDTEALSIHKENSQPLTIRITVKNRI